MAAGGKRAGAGRKKGVPNKRTAEVVQAVADGGITPLDYLLSVMRDEAGDPVRRVDAAKAAAQYVHPKLAAVEHTGKDGGPIRSRVEVEFVQSQAAPGV